MSMILRPNLHLSQSIHVTTSVAVAICQVIERLTNQKPQIKWVNDIYLNDKKICGILTEAVSDFELGIIQNIIIGIGVNLRPQDFPPDLMQAASLNLTDVSRNEIIASIVNAVQKALAHLKEPQWLEEYRYRSVILGKEISFEQNGVVNYATAIDIDSAGGLVIRLQDGTTTVLNSGEITVRSLSASSKLSK